MTIKRLLLSVAAPIALLGVSGCATNFQANVSRFQRLPAPQGQTYRIEASNPQERGGLEFATYAQEVSAHLTQVGYHEAAPGGPADMIVQVGYGVDHGQQKVTTTPGGFDCGFGGPGWGGGWGWGGGFGRWGGYGWGGRGWGFGWGDPYGPWGCPDVESYTVYSSYLGMTITRSDGARLFEGRARAHSTTDDLTQLVPNLIDAMFTGFPGNSGQDIKITIPPRQKPKAS
ncbi:DUF4136 domain-containing protein [Sphingomonas sp. CGMCC 1.13654]|uniref:DUF4136 domain-containing protein n=1 Tax=Sphingomonas chungangi TaxID=2683589 RepID=A0A838LG89_9SPHN|nr:DUF4136 domain-containing protein [Sphingomonas chungangi]MBA2936438.1 DUF4136 domain-containing protein [Sphingomonas chungangi]MVW55823.1 DUF4136 domain-containing protein [Sphingomonas chungangi]